MTKTARISDSPTQFVRLGAAAPEAGQVALVPGHEIPLIALDLPKGLRGQAREQVARRQLSDRMGLQDDVEMRPFAPGKTRDGWNRVLIASRARVASWKDLTCRAVLPDYLSLPTADGLWTIATDQIGEAELIMVRLGPEDGFSAAPEIATAMLERTLATGPRPRAILNEGPALPALKAMAHAHDVPVVDTAEGLSQHGIDLPRVLGHGEITCDLRNDPLAARARLARRVLPWRWPLLAGALAAGLWGATQMLAIDRIEAQTAAVTAQTRALVQSHFVTSGPVLDMRVQVSRALSELRAATQTTDTGTDPLELAAAVADVLAREQAPPEMFSYRAGDGLLVVLRLPDFAAGERITASLKAERLRASLEESRVNDTRAGVRTEIRIRAGETSP